MKLVPTKPSEDYWSAGGIFVLSAAGLVAGLLWNQSAIVLLSLLFGSGAVLQIRDKWRKAKLARKLEADPELRRIWENRAHDD